MWGNGFPAPEHLELTPRGTPGIHSPLTPPPNLVILDFDVSDETSPLDLGSLCPTLTTLAGVCQEELGKAFTRQPWEMTLRASCHLLL
eukprot:3242055-Rhodomonas_salina.1